MRCIARLIARLSAVTAIALGAVAIVVMLRSPAPLRLCSLLGQCMTANLTGSMYFSGDSMAAPVFHLRLVVAPILALVGVSLVERGRGWAGVTLAASSALAVGVPQVVGTYALLPLHPLVFGAILATVGALVAHLVFRHAPVRESRPVP